ncbi:MAG: glycosyltransferase family 9 protein [Candidatus Syntrophosphaera sp.]|nr:glycosyltransferase family 9 protein [Candidatus Syntrophosphaera sp.]
MRILVLRLSSLGDIILTQPVVAELRQLHPEAEIDFLCKPEYATLPGLFGLDLKVIEYSKNLGWHLRLAGHKYDLVIDLHSKFSTWLVSRLVRAKQKVAYAKQRKLRRAIVRGDRNATIEATVRLYYSALERLYPDAFNSRTPIRFPALELAEPVESGQGGGKKRIGLFLGAAHATKAYPVEQWREFLRLSGDRHEFRLYGNKADGILAKDLCREFPELKDLCGSLDLLELTREIQLCDAIISGDSGPMHIAAALSKPQIAIFGGTHPRLGFAPLNHKARTLSADLDCQPCSLHGLESCPQGHFNCMKEITPSRLADALNALLRS